MASPSTVQRTGVGANTGSGAASYAGASTYKPSSRAVHHKPMLQSVASATTVASLLGGSSAGSPSLALSTLTLHSPAAAPANGSSAMHDFLPFETLAAASVAASAATATATAPVPTPAPLMSTPSGSPYHANPNAMSIASAAAAVAAVAAVGGASTGDEKSLHASAPVQAASSAYDSKLAKMDQSSSVGAVAATATADAAEALARIQAFDGSQLSASGKVVRVCRYAYLPDREPELRAFLSEYLTKFRGAPGVRSVEASINTRDHTWSYHFIFNTQSDAANFKKSTILVHSAVAGRTFADLPRMHASMQPSALHALTSTPFLESFGDLYDQ